MSYYVFPAARETLVANIKACQDKTVGDCDASGLFEIKMPVHKKTLQGHIKKILALSWKADCKTLAAGDQGGKVIVWDATTGMKKKVLDQDFTMATELHPTQDILVVGAMNNLATVYKTGGEGCEGPTCKKIKELQCHEGYVSSVKFPTDDCMITTGGDGMTAVWDVKKWDVVSRLYGHIGDCSCIRFPKTSTDIFCTSSSDKTVRVWDKRQLKCTHLFQLSDECNATAFMPNGMCVAAGCNDGNGFLFDLRSQAQLQKMGRKNNRISGAEFSLSGRILYYAYEDGHLGLWDTVGSGGYKAKLDAHFSNNEGINRIVAHTAMCPDGSALVTAGYDAAIKIWSV